MFLMQKKRMVYKEQKKENMSDKYSERIERKANKFIGINIRDLS